MNIPNVVIDWSQNVPTMLCMQGVEAVRCFNDTITARHLKYVLWRWWWCGVIWCLHGSTLTRFLLSNRVENGICCQFKRSQCRWAISMSFIFKMSSSCLSHVTVWSEALLGCLGPVTGHDTWPSCWYIYRNITGISEGRGHREPTALRGTLDIWMFFRDVAPFEQTVTSQ